MKSHYDEETDTLTLVLRDMPMAESTEVKPGAILDHDGEENLVSLEILDASRRVDDPHTVKVGPWHPVRA